MSTQNNTFKTAEEYKKNSLKWLSESANVMADIYKKQFKLGYDMYSNFINTGLQSGHVKPNFSNNIFHSNIEMLKENIDNISKLSEKTVSTVMNSFAGKEYNSGDEKKIIDSVMDAYRMQAKQITETNHRFFEAYNETFKKANTDTEKAYAIFKKNTEGNFHKSEEVINSALKTYSSSINKSDKNREELFDNINNQMESLIKNSLSQWSDFIQTMEKEHKTTVEKVKETKILK